MENEGLRVAFPHVAKIFSFDVVKCNHRLPNLFEDSSYSYNLVLLDAVGVS